MSDDGPVCLTRRVTPWFEEAFRSHALGERLTWEVTFGFAQAEQGVVPQFLLYAQLPAATLGQCHMAVAQILVFGLSGKAAGGSGGGGGGGEAVGAAQRGAGAAQRARRPPHRRRTRRPGLVSNAEESAHD